ncbi:KHG/KDPG aldolase [Includes: 4-hydroxy-2-oxoglutarate aldolase (2-keto-4-hydroxyglutarate aldolase) (KHG-aldolase), partial [Durusdinium trenchii]
SSSAFARFAHELEWSSLKSSSWFHVSGITPLLGDNAQRSWKAAMHEVLILSTDQLSGLAELLLNTSLEGDSDTVYLHIMSRLIRQLKCKMNAVAEVLGQQALRRADLLSALSQNTEGPIVSVPSFAVDAAEVIEMTLKKMKDAKVLPIFRVKGDAQVAINRGVELASLGCKAMEVTMDSADWQLILSSLHQRLPDVILGVGTVMDDTVSQIPLAKSLGASFALSPIDPIGFIEVCKNLGVLAVPSAFTSNECWSMHRRGARLIKLFHAGLASPAILKAMLDVTPLGENLNILPSGSVSPGNASEWLKAGASIVGMGSNLVGKDISLKPGTAEFHAAVDDWRSKGRPIVEKMLKDLALLTP